MTRLVVHVHQREGWWTCDCGEKRTFDNKFNVHGSATAHSARHGKRCAGIRYHYDN